MIRFTSCFVLLCFAFFTSAQIIVDNEVSEEQVVNALVGEGVSIVSGSITKRCPDVAFGTFSGESNMGIDKGIILTTGDATLAEGPNNEEGAHLKNLSFETDEDLQALIPDFEIMDVCVIEFDFIPDGDKLTFEYVFGSEEYHDFIEGDFNDVFGFFVSGPGIEGEFTKDAKNIALVPGTDFHVSIQTINNGLVCLDMENQITQNCGETNEDDCVNCEYFVYNGDGDDFFNEEWFYDDRFIQYDGFTTILTANVDVMPNETYHMKLAISDAGDTTFDTGVFLAGQSFSTNAPNLSAGGIEGDTKYDNAVAGCVDGQFIFKFDEPVSCDVTINFEVRGTAVSGTDYSDFGSSVSLAEGETEQKLLVPILDGATGSKTVELYNISISNETCGIIETDNITLSIEDAPVFSVSEDQTINSGNSAEIEASGGFTYEWTNTGLAEPTKESQTVSPTETTEYTVNVSYGRCAQTLSTRVIVQDDPLTCELEATDINTEDCNDSSYNLIFDLNGAAIGDAISVTDRNGDEVGSFTVNNDRVRLGPIPTGQTVLTITNTTNTDCPALEIDVTSKVVECTDPSPCFISVTMGSIASCTRSTYDLMLAVTGIENGESFTVTTANGTNLGSFNYADMPAVVSGIPVDQTILFITDNTFSDCTTQTIDIFPVVQGCVNLVPECSVIEASASVEDCTDNDLTVSLEVTSNSTGNSFTVVDNLGNSLGIYNYEDGPVSIDALSLDVTSLTVTDSGNSECTTQTEDLTEAIITACTENMEMCSITIDATEIVSCTDTTYTLSLNLNAMDASESFTVTDAAGNDLGTFNYADAPVEVSNINLSESILTITDSGDEACSIVTNNLADAISEACTDDPTPTCAITAVMAMLSTCTDSTYTVTLAVMGENTGASYSVTDGSGNDLGTFNYADGGVEISGINISETVLTVSDIDSTDCSANSNDLTTAIQICDGIDSMECSISASAMLVTCTENDYTAMLNVTGENTGTTFSVTDAAGNDLGTFNYADVPVEIAGIDTSSNILTITDGDDADCAASTNDLAEDIQMCIDGLTGMTCSVSVMAMLSTCTENDYTLRLMIAGQNTGDSFSVTDASGNDLGTYNYSDSPIEIGGVALTESVFVVTDVNNSNCVATTNNISGEIQDCLEDLMQPTGECSLSASDIELVRCTDDSYTVSVTVNSSNAGDSFRVVDVMGALFANYDYTGDNTTIQIDNISLDNNFVFIIDNTINTCFVLLDLAEQIAACDDPPPPPPTDCTLDISAGLLSLENDLICDGDRPVASVTDPTIPIGYNTYYVFHNNDNLTPEGLSNTQVYAITDSNFFLDNSLIPCGTPIYVTAVISEIVVGASNVDLNAACTTFGNTLEVIFLCPISIDVEELCNQATGTFILNIVVKGGLPALQPASEFDISGDIYSGAVGNDELISIANVPDGSDFRIIATDEFGCTNEISGSILCKKKLPVELVAFTGEAQSNGNLLKWSTASEINNDFYTIEHSRDGLTYQMLTTVKGVGTTTNVNNYNYLDRNAANGTTYYRLLQTDFDGTTKVEDIIFITRGEDIGVNLIGIYPLPFVEDLTIQLSSLDEIYVRFSLIDISGKLLIRDDYSLISGLTQVELNTAAFATGMYLLRIETENGSIVKKVIKQ